jgi:hypothetical protein
MAKDREEWRQIICCCCNGPERSVKSQRRRIHICIQIYILKIYFRISEPLCAVYAQYRIIILYIHYVETLLIMRTPKTVSTDNNIIHTEIMRTSNMTIYRFIKQIAALYYNTSIIAYMHIKYIYIYIYIYIYVRGL